MALFGEEVKPAKKRARRDNPAGEGSASQRWNQLQTRKAEAAQARLGSLKTEHQPVQDQISSEPPLQHHDLDSNEDDDGDNGDEVIAPQVYEELHLVEEANPASGEGDNLTVIPANRSDYYRGVTYQERTLCEEADWQDVIPQIFRVFIPCAQKTRQWGDQNLWNFDWNSQCRCAGWQKSEVEVDAIDILSRQKIKLQTCRCIPDVVRLVMKGYMGGSADRPRTAFSIRLLRFNHILWKHCTARLAPFVEGLNEFLDASNALFLVPGTDNTRDWRKNFSAAVDAYREMIRLEEEMVTKALHLTPIDQLASNCPPCFGPVVPGKRAEEPNYIICLDGNFQHRRHMAASASWRACEGVGVAIGATRA
ncbi:uncharacterized protein MELLADRAFT_85893 [Melampsora larici-populina 98AG31]|uniref:CxC1-like cysteine cluster associated with KDZ transposases domain-containing protein n=1 Tax=Melampsora larici-populina (strain 98AG31 / pathotype 3-4-7) TaxID=747676 RepID=F4RK13_MELLP|nr:uncharacterized protein MELLADRAFT_85893 [Melampsora larici-populina 98AG31]EGG07021.1 hypothetical protein MELLADRAFT_85893 [Melampsora larici-populina 98AG31]